MKKEAISLGVSIVVLFALVGGGGASLNGGSEANAIVLIPAGQKRVDKDMDVYNDRPNIALSGEVALLASEANKEDRKQLKEAVSKITFGVIGDSKGIERRLRLMFAIGTTEDISFKELTELTEDSSGALSHDLRRLEDKKLINATRVFVENKARKTTYTLSEEGKNNLKTCLKGLVGCLSRLG